MVNARELNYTRHIMGRRQNRYLRRKEQREKRRLQALKNNLTFDNVNNYKSLYKAANKSAKGVKWKASVQKYFLNLFTHLARTKNKLDTGKDVRKGFIEFDINERGKTRHIRSVHFEERVIQKALCSEALYPVMTYNLIADNGASQKGKGTHYATQRLIKSLLEHYKKYGNEGYILVIDFKSYFDNILHKPMKDLFRKYFSDEKIINLTNMFIDAFGEKGLGLGSETSQISAVAYVNKIDHYIKEQLSIKYYGKYMDDSYFIHYEKAYLLELLNKLRVLYSRYGVKLNEQKTCIIPLKQGFTFLKTKFFLTSSGKIIKKACRESIVRERRKLKRQAVLLQKGVLSEKDIEISFASWLGSMKHRHARRTVYEMKKLYSKLIGGKQNGN